ncbi:hypothetical protein BOW57_01390 [Flavobacterium sp. YO64]|nr:hypothetical protein BOW57_01390 [Flavobacterium sp. YO64]
MICSQVLPQRHKDYAKFAKVYYKTLRTLRFLLGVFAVKYYFFTLRTNNINPKKARLNPRQKEIVLIGYPNVVANPKPARSQPKNIIQMGNK